MKRLIIDGRFDILEVYNDGDTLLTNSILSDEKEMVAYLLSIPCISPNAARSDGSSPLHLAIRYGSEVVNVLLSDSRIDVKAINNEGEQPLHYAARLGKREALKLLISDPRIDPWAKTLEVDPSLKGNDAMDLAIEAEHKHVVKYFQTLWVMGVK
jgi:ankyrin repeat protein